MSTPLRAIVIVAHPNADSFAHANAAAAERGLTRGGVEVDVVDLYADGFRAAMTLDERLHYDSDEIVPPLLDPLTVAYAQRITAADIAVFVYPTWWSTVPAILKGFLDRVLVPGIGFRLTPNGKVRPGLTNISTIVGISTYGSPRNYVRLINDNGRRTLARTLRLSCGLKTRVRWFPLYNMDGVDDAARSAFTESIEERLFELATTASNRRLRPRPTMPKLPVARRTGSRWWPR